MGLKSGDRVAYELHDGVVHLARMEAFDAAFHEARSETLDEWTTPADEQAFRDPAPRLLARAPRASRGQPPVRL